ncbi:MAG: OmpA family protein [Alphaproteobacteria bacterium]|nr:OmpA family protein [Alphaproteobacteria bacterium]
MKALLKFLAGCVVIGVIGIVSIHMDWLPGSAQSAERHLLDKALRAIDAAGADWAGVEIDGQKAVLFGEAPSREALDTLKTGVARAQWPGGLALGGITILDASNMTVFSGPPLADPFVWIAQLQAGQLVLSGYAPSPSARDAVFLLAAMRFPDADISGALEIASGAPPEDSWLSAASISLQALARLDNGAVEANGPAFEVSGVVADSAGAAAIERLMAMINDGLSGAAKLTLAPPEITQPEITQEESETLSEGPVAADTGAAPAAVAEPDRALRCAGQSRSILSAAQISFARDRASLNGASRELLDALAAALGACPGLKIAITGHTDAAGGTAANRRLSLARARAVGDYLRTAGVDAARITTSGAGESQPLVSNRTAEGRARNRRIEFEFTPGNQD